MMFLVELDHVKTTAPLTPEAGRVFIRGDQHRRSPTS
jgi:hypothetical protein